MFDPLSNFKLNKILSAVNALPTTLASSFTEVKNAIAGVQNTANTIDGKVDTIGTNVNNLVNEPFYGRDKIITKDDALNFRYVKKEFTTTTSYSDLVNVSGSGVIELVAFYFGVGHERTGSAQFKMIIDDVEFIMNSDSDNADESRYIFVSKDDFLNTDSLNNHRIIYTKTGFALPIAGGDDFITPGDGGYRDSRPFTELTKNLLTSGATMSGDTFLVYDGYLKFNKNFRAQAKISSANSVNACGFALYSLM